MNFKTAQEAEYGPYVLLYRNSVIRLPKSFTAPLESAAIDEQLAMLDAMDEAKETRQ